MSYLDLHFEEGGGIIKIGCGEFPDEELSGLSLSNLTHRGGGEGVGGREGRNFKISVNIGNELKKRHKCYILILNVKVSKQTRTEANKNNGIIQRVSNISIN